MAGLLLSVSPEVKQINDSISRQHIYSSSSTNDSTTSPKRLLELHLSRSSVLFSFHCIIVLYRSVRRYRLREASCFSTSLIRSCVRCLHRVQTLCFWHLSSWRTAWKNVNVIYHQCGAPQQSFHLQLTYHPLRKHLFLELLRLPPPGVKHPGALAPPDNTVDRQIIWTYSSTHWGWKLQSLHTNQYKPKSR